MKFVIEGDFESVSDAMLALVDADQHVEIRTLDSLEAVCQEAMTLLADIQNNLWDIPESTVWETKAVTEARETVNLIRVTHLAEEDFE